MKKLILILPILLIMSSSTIKAQTTQEQGKFAHIVYFWLNNPDNKEDRKAFEVSLISFINQSEFIQSKFVGTPAKTDRDIIDNSYTYSLILSFKNKTMQDKYQDEPNHKKFIAESSGLWKKVLVYDSENILK